MAPPSSPSSDGSRTPARSGGRKVTRPVRNRLFPPDRHDGTWAMMVSDIGLPDAHLAGAVFRDAGRIDQAGVDGEGPGAGGERLPQLPLQSTNALSMATWPKR